MADFHTEKDYAEYIHKVTKPGDKIKFVAGRYYPEIDVGQIGIVTEISLNPRDLFIRADWPRKKGRAVYFRFITHI